MTASIKMYKKIVRKLAPYLIPFKNIGELKELSLQEERKKIAVIFIAILGIPFSLVLATGHLIHKNYLPLTLNLLSLFFFAGLIFVVMKYKITTKAFFRFGIAFATLVVLFIIPLTGREGESIFWIYFIPLITIFILGKNEGLIWSLAFLFVLNLILFYPGTPIFFNNEAYPQFALYRANQSYLVGLLMIIAIEHYSEKFYRLAFLFNRKISISRDKLKKVNRELNYANKIKIQFLQKMSHELRTPLNAIIGMNDLMLETGLTKEQKDFIHTSQKSSKHLLFLINDILDFSKGLDNNISLQYNNIGLRELLHSTYQSFSKDAKSKRLDFKLNIDKDLPDCAETDPVRLTQILNNLISNAIKFTNSGKIEIRATLKEPDKSPAKNVGSLQARQKYLSFEVIDTGPGIPEAQREKIFEDFYQLDLHRNSNYPGSGLGLAICRQLTKLLNGKLILNSEQGKGSTFTLLLPFQEIKCLERDSFSYPSSTDLPNLYEMLQQFKKTSVLLVEDNFDNRTLVKSYLRDLNLEVDCAFNGKEAHEMFEKKNYDIIFMDIQMPEMDGYEATRIIRQREKDLQRTPALIIALTAQSYTEDIQKSFDAGMDAHLSKPFQKREFIYHLRRSLSGYLEKSREKTNKF